jgi:hypothetical protein
LLSNERGNEPSARNNAPNPQTSVIARTVRPVAIQMDVEDALSFQETRPPLGLPRRCAPRNDGVFPRLAVTNTFVVEQPQQ